MSFLLEQRRVFQEISKFYKIGVQRVYIIITNRIMVSTGVCTDHGLPLGEQKIK
jgi:hypothetical protein